MARDRGSGTLKWVQMDDESKTSLDAARDKRIEELARYAALKWSSWGGRFKKVGFNDREDLLQIARLVWWRSRERLRELESEAHVAAYLKLAIKCAIMYDEGIREGKRKRLITRSFGTVKSKNGDEKPLEDFVPSNESDPSDAFEERTSYQEDLARTRAFLEEYSRKKNAKTREILKTTFTEETDVSIAKRLGCSRRYVSEVKMRFVEAAKKRFKGERAIRRAGTMEE